MKKRTLVAGSYQRHYAKLPTCILMYRERKNLVEVPAGALVGIHKAGRRNHICTVANGKGKAKEIWYLSIPAENMPKIKVEGVEAKAKKGGKKGTKAVAPVVAVETPAVEVPAGMGPQDIAPVEQPAPQPVVAPEVQPEAPAPAPEVAPVEQPVEAAV